jgi:hypothetical protein
VDNGLGDRQRYDPDGKPITPDQAHGKCPNSTPSTPSTPSTGPNPQVEKAIVETGVVGTLLLILYYISTVFN